MFSQIVQMALPFVLSVIMLYVVIELSPCVFHRMTDPPGTDPILLPPLRVAVLESPPRPKVWCPKLPNVSKAKPSSGPFNVVRLTEPLFCWGQRELSEKGGASPPSRGRCLDSPFPLFYNFKSVLV